MFCSFRGLCVCLAIVHPRKHDSTRLRKKISAYINNNYILWSNIARLHVFPWAYTETTTTISTLTEPTATTKSVRVIKNMLEFRCWMERNIVQVSLLVLCKSISGARAFRFGLLESNSKRHDNNELENSLQRWLTATDEGNVYSRFAAC